MIGSGSGNIWSILFQAVIIVLNPYLVSRSYAFYGILLFVVGGYKMLGPKKQEDNMAKPLKAVLETLDF
jgi:hypothetical protein